MENIVCNICILNAKPLIFSLIYMKRMLTANPLQFSLLTLYPFLAAFQSRNTVEPVRDILEHLEQGVALADNSLKIVFSNRKFQRLISACFGTEQSAELSKYIRSLGNRKRAVFRIEPKTNSQFFLVIKTFREGKDKFYLLTLNKKRLRKIDLFKALQSEYKISLDQFKIITYLSKGFNNNEIARLCDLKTCNVKYHLTHLYDTFYVSNRTEFLNKVKELENDVS